jgi:hypothetical protein
MWRIVLDPVEELRQRRAMAHLKIKGEAERYFATLGAMIRDGIPIPESEAPYIVEAVKRLVKNPAMCRSLLGIRGRPHDVSVHRKQAETARLVAEQRAAGLLDKQATSVVSKLTKLPESVVQDHWRRYRKRLLKIYGITRKRRTPNT